MLMLTQAQVEALLEIDTLIDALAVAMVTRACPVDHGAGSRSQILIDAMSMVPR
jgi:hypothetical protein